MGISCDSLSLKRSNWPLIRHDICNCLIVGKELMEGPPLILWCQDSIIAWEKFIPPHPQSSFQTRLLEKKKAQQLCEFLLFLLAKINFFGVKKGNRSMTAFCNKLMRVSYS